jgi:ATP-dependent helicase HrpB
MQPLPIDEVLPALLASLRANPNAVIEAPTGAGKSTRVPRALLDAGIQGEILVLEPRRIAARAVARRLAEEHGTRLGDVIGFQVRFEREDSANTRVRIVTEGILLRRLQDDPFLDGVGAVVFDEVHERSLTLDLALALTRQVQRDARPDLHILAMSATAETGRLAEFLDAPVLRSAGRTFPVAVHHDRIPDSRPVEDRVADAVHVALAATSGHLLAFLPGVREIQRTIQAIGTVNGVDVLPLHGQLPAAEQDAVFSDRGRRKVIVSTNVAETSVTVPGVTAVIDAGLARRDEVHPDTGLSRLITARISRASADQRAGRAGRTGPGIAWRLWTDRDHLDRPAHDPPEVHRADLSAATLQLLAWGERDPAAFPWFERPSESALRRARRVLERLGAADGDGLTPLGHTLAKISAHPRVARLLVAGAELGHLEAVAGVAALLEDRPPFDLGAELPPSSSDLLELLDALDAFAARKPSPLRLRSPVGARFATQARAQLAREVGRLKIPVVRSEDRDTAVRRALLAAFPDRVATRREPGGERARLVGGRGVRVAPASTVRQATWFVAVDVDHEGFNRADGWVRLASSIEPGWLPTRRVRTGTFDGTRLIGVERLMYEDLVLEERRGVPIEGRAAAEALAELAREDLDAAIPEDVGVLFRRLRFLRREMPELELPEPSEEALLAALDDLCDGRRSLGELRAAPWTDALLGALSHVQRRQIEAHAPVQVTVPSGSRITLEWVDDGPPILPVRIQELYGCARTPTVADGRVPVMLHLLAPNHRPQQVTQDLAGFWARTYKEVRSELRQRYPRHAWPDDPLMAAPEKRPQRRH